MKRKIKTAAVICLIIGLAAGTAEILGSRITDQPEEEEPPGDAALVAKAASPHEGKNIHDSADLALGAEGAILIDTKDKTVLFEKNADKTVPCQHHKDHDCPCRSGDTGGDRGRARQPCDGT